MFLVLSLLTTVALGTFLFVFRAAQELEGGAARAVLRSAQGRGRFVLYLRAFDTDENWSDIPAPSWGIWGLFGVFWNFFRHPVFSPTVRFEGFIRRVTGATFGKLPAIAVASANETLGIGRVKLHPHEWKTQVSALCSDAKAIVFLVGGSSGLVWELTHIIEARHLRKTVFVIPPWDIMKRHYGVAAEVIIKRARDIFLSLGITLPPPNWPGRVFVVSETKEILLIRDIDLLWSSDKNFAAALSAVAQN